MITETHTSTSGASGLISKLLLVILAVFLPPVSVILTDGCGIHLLINVILLIFTAWIGAIIHALFLVFRQPTKLHTRTVTTQP